MKKITLILGILLLLSSCYSNPKDLEKIEELEEKILIKNLENSEIIEENKIQVLLLEDKIETLESQSKNNLFQKNQQCGKYKSEVGKKESLVELFYSPIKNTCILGTFYYEKFDEGISFIFIKDVVSGTGISLYDCNKSTSCVKDFQDKISSLK